MAPDAVGFRAIYQLARAAGEAEHEVVGRVGGGDRLDAVEPRHAVIEVDDRVARAQRHVEQTVLHGGAMARRQDVGGCEHDGFGGGEAAPDAVRQHGKRAGRRGHQVRPALAGPGRQSEGAGQALAGQADALAGRGVRGDKGAGGVDRKARGAERGRGVGLRPDQRFGMGDGFAPGGFVQIQPVRRKRPAGGAAQGDAGSARLGDLGQVVGRAFGGLRIEQDARPGEQREQAFQVAGEQREIVFQAGYAVRRRLVRAEHQLGGRPDRPAGHHADAALARGVEPVDLADGLRAGRAFQADAQSGAAIGGDHVEQGRVQGDFAWVVRFVHGRVAEAEEGRADRRRVDRLAGFEP